MWCRTEKLRTARSSDSNDIEDFEQVRDRDHSTHAVGEAEQAEVSSAAPEADVLGDQSADASAIDVGDFAKIQEDPDSPLPDEELDVLGTRRVLVHDQPTLQIEDRDVADPAFGYLHTPRHG